MTFRDYFRELGIAAFFSAARRVVDRREELAGNLTGLYSDLKAEQQGRRDDQRTFIDTILAKNQVSPVFQPPLPPLPTIARERTPFEVMNDGQAQIDKETADYQRAYDEQTRNAYPPAVQAAAERLRAQ